MQQRQRPQVARRREQPQQVVHPVRAQPLDARGKQQDADVSHRTRAEVDAIHVGGIQHPDRGQAVEHKTAAQRTQRRRDAGDQEVENAEIEPVGGRREVEVVDAVGAGGTVGAEAGKEEHRAQVHPHGGDAVERRRDGQHHRGHGQDRGEQRNQRLGADPVDHESAHQRHDDGAGGAHRAQQHGGVVAQAVHPFGVDHQERQHHRCREAVHRQQGQEARHTAPVQRPPERADEAGGAVGRGRFGEAKHQPGGGETDRDAGAHQQGVQEERRLLLQQQSDRQSGGDAGGMDHELIARQERAALGFGGDGADDRIVTGNGDAARQVEADHARRNQPDADRRGAAREQRRQQDRRHQRIAGDPEDAHGTHRAEPAHDQAAEQRHELSKRNERVQQADQQVVGAEAQRVERDQVPGQQVERDHVEEREPREIALRGAHLARGQAAVFGNAGDGHCPVPPGGG